MIRSQRSPRRTRMRDCYVRTNSTASPICLPGAMSHLWWRICSQSVTLLTSWRDGVLSCLCPRCCSRLAAGTPVVSTTLGIEGLPLAHGKEVLIADTPEKMADCLISLEQDSQQWHRLSENARRRVQTTYDWSVAGQRLFQLYVEQLQGIKDRGPLCATTCL